MKLRQRIQEEMKAAMRSKDALRVSTLRLLLATIKNKEIEKGKGASLAEEEVLRLITAAAKQRRDSIDQFSKAGRQDLAEKEGRELEILKDFLPEPLSSEALRKAVEACISEVGAAGMQDMGRLMKLLVPRLMGHAEGKAIRQMVQACLQKRA